MRSSDAKTHLQQNKHSCNYSANKKINEYGGISE